jgi:hypothetical protein
MDHGRIFQFYWYTDLFFTVSVPEKRLTFLISLFCIIINLRKISGDFHLCYLKGFFYCNFEFKSKKSLWEYLFKPISDPNCSKQLLTWSQQFREVVFLDSNAYDHSYSSYSGLIAVDAFTFKTDFTMLFDLAQYQQTTEIGCLVICPMISKKWFGAITV